MSGGGGGGGGGGDGDGGGDGGDAAGTPGDGVAGVTGVSSTAPASDSASIGQAAAALGYGQLGGVSNSIGVSPGMGVMGQDSNTAASDAAATNADSLGFSVSNASPSEAATLGQVSASPYGQSEAMSASEAASLRGQMGFTNETNTSPSDATSMASAQGLGYNTNVGMGFPTNRGNDVGVAEAANMSAASVQALSRALGVPATAANIGVLGQVAATLGVSNAGNNSASLRGSNAPLGPAQGYPAVQGNNMALGQAASMPGIGPSMGYSAYGANPFGQQQQAHNNSMSLGPSNVSNTSNPAQSNSAPVGLAPAQQSALAGMLKGDANSQAYARAMLGGVLSRAGAGGNYKQ